jgi:hypothetical protein
MTTRYENNSRIYTVKGEDKGWSDLTTRQKRYYLRHIDKSEWENINKGVGAYYTIEQRQHLLDEYEATNRLKASNTRLQATISDTPATLLKQTAHLLAGLKDLDKVFDYSGKYEQIELDNMKYTGTAHWKNTLFNRLGYDKPWYPKDYWNKWKRVITMGLVK